MTDGKKKAAALTDVSLILAAAFWGINYAATKFAALSIPRSRSTIRSLMGVIVKHCVLRGLDGWRPPSYGEWYRHAY